MIENRNIDYVKMGRRDGHGEGRWEAVRGVKVGYGTDQLPKIYILSLLYQHTLIKNENSKQKKANGLHFQ